MNYLLDTHILVGRFLQPSSLSKKMRNLFSDKDSIFLIPTISLLEVQYLKEIGRIEINLDEVLWTLKDDDYFRIIPYDEAAMIQSFHLTGTRDPFDRIILGQALALSTKILTKDRWMKKTAPHLVISS